MSSQEQIELFVKTYYPYAFLVQHQTGVSATAILTQAALESGWGKRALGNNFFGIKDRDGINGNEQLLTTTEFLPTATAKFPEVISVVKQAGSHLFKYLVKDYFRKYDTPLDSFIDHAALFKRAVRYKKAYEVRHLPDLFFEEIHKAGYATAPNYAEVLKSLHKRIDIEVKKLFPNQ